MNHYDLIIIGSGPSGRSAAIQAGKLGSVDIHLELMMAEHRQIIAA